MHRNAFSALLTLVSLISFATGSQAQSLNFSIGSSAVIDRLVAGAAQQRAEAEAPAPAGGEVGTAAVGPKESGPFKELTLMTTYEYTFKDSKAGDGRETDIHFVAPEFHVKTQGDFALNLSVGYASLRARDRAGFEVDANSFVLILTPVQELLPKAMNDKGTFLFGGSALAYRHTQAESGLFAIESETDAFAMAPTLFATQVLPDLKTSVSGGVVYTYETTDNDVSGLDIDDSSGIVSLQLRGDRFFPGIPLKEGDTATQAWIIAAWKHDTEVADFPAPSPEKEDWAEFGGFVTWDVRPTVGLHGGYSIETLRDDTTNHKLTLRVEGYL